MKVTLDPAKFTQLAPSHICQHFACDSLVRERAILRDMMVSQMDQYDNFLCVVTIETAALAVSYSSLACDVISDFSPSSPLS